jgi:broad specificity phosphatase PhoE
VAARLGGEVIDAVYSSPLSRALDTARPLAARLGLTVAVREELKEIDYGRFQGLSKTDQSVKLRHDFLFEPVPGGESLNDVYRRVGRAWTELREELARGRTLAVVGHYWSNRILLGAIHELALEDLFERTRYKPANGSIYRVEFLPGADGKPAVRSAAWVSEGTAGASD